MKYYLKALQKGWFGEFLSCSGSVQRELFHSGSFQRELFPSDSVCTLFRFGGSWF
ncbi:hypothetical protein MtrunA17_Chr3g0108771 [Medicago truncatula]|uniref:Uncharacterized protein n=1 Tax=Medicago truncatula TaxID=3880 RepID=G7JNB9_MEDTR|nr:hypothetical protein MTR_4g058550 [Medicago truncatula]RHN67983.1 hypothetical protein MtrunA17_Chr3g0108771 [Medicago truncatula]